MPTFTYAKTSKAMRTIDQIRKNADTCFQLTVALQKQIKIFEADYIANSIEKLGFPLPEWVEAVNKLKAATESLTLLGRLENDYADDLAEENED